MSLISIIVPTYNSSKTILETIDSIRNQNFDNYEVLIMDGKSSDNTLEIIDKINDPKIRIFSQSDLGVYDAMNKGVTHSKGEWLYFLGSDDCLYDNNVLSYVAIATEENNSNFIYGDCYWKNSKIVYDGEFDFLKLLEQNICHQGIFYRKDFFEQVGRYNLKYKIFADYEFNIRCYIHPSFKPAYKKRHIAIYNDGLGLSGGNDDQEFYKYQEFVRGIAHKVIHNQKKRFLKNFGISSGLIESIYSTISVFKMNIKRKRN